MTPSPRRSTCLTHGMYGPFFMVLMTMSIMDAGLSITTAVREGATPSWSLLPFLLALEPTPPSDVIGAGTAAVDGERSTCPRALVQKLHAARAKVESSNLLTAMVQYFKPLAESPELPQCTSDFQLRVLKEYGDVLARLAAKTSDSSRQTELRREAAAQYGRYLLRYLENPWQLRDPIESEPPRIVLYSYGDMVFATKEYNNLFDLYAKAVEKYPDLFDSRTIDLWRKAIEAAGLTVETVQKSRPEYCHLSAPGKVRIGEGSRTQFFGGCAS
jgi:hypothetical protein